MHIQLFYFLLPPLTLYMMSVFSTSLQIPPHTVKCCLLSTYGCLTSQQPTFYLYHITFPKGFSWRQGKRDCPSWQLKNCAPQKFSDLLLYARALFCKTPPIASDCNRNKLQTSFLGSQKPSVLQTHPPRTSPLFSSPQPMPCAISLNTTL